MDEDRVAGVVRRVKGSIKEAIGKLTGDTRTQTEGAAEKADADEQDTTRQLSDAARRPPGGSLPDA